MASLPEAAGQADVAASWGQDGGAALYPQNWHCKGRMLGMIDTDGLCKGNIQ